jgi:hypothetical protein
MIVKVKTVLYGVAILVAVSVVGTLAKYGVENKFQRALNQAASSASKSLPKTVEPGIRFDRVTSPGNKRLVYEYSFFERLASEFDAASARRKTYRVLLNNSCDDPEQKDWFSKGVTNVYLFRDRVGTEVFRVNVTKADCDKLSQQPAPASTELTRNEAGELLQGALADGFRKECSLDQVLTRKPEFASIKGEAFCSKKVAVTGIQTTSPTEALVEWHVSTDANLPALEKWLAAMGKLQERLKAISSTAYCAAEGFQKGSCAVTGYKFIDTADKQEFWSVGSKVWGGKWPLSETRTPITETNEWKHLEGLQQYVSALVKNGKIIDPIRNSHFQLWDDGWRMVEPSIK